MLKILCYWLHWHFFLVFIHTRCEFFFEKCTHVKLKTHALILFPALSRYPPTPPIKLPVSTWQHGKWTILKAIFTAALNWLSVQSFYIVSGMIWLGEIVSYPTFHLVLPLNQCILQWLQSTMRRLHKLNSSELSASNHVLLKVAH